MNWEYSFAAALVGWFVLLALAEAFFAQRATSGERTNDGRLVTNFGLMALIILLGSLAPLGSAALVAERYGIGLAQNVALPVLAIVLITLIAQTFVAYWVHRLMHRVPLLWRVHRVHHADSEVDVSTSFRNHPLELLLTVPAPAAVILLVGTPVEVVLITQSLLSAVLILEHADVPLPQWLERVLAPVIVTPRLHRQHHSPERAIHDTNFGELVIVWDRLFGTFSTTATRGRVGLDGEPIRADHLLDQLCSPLRGATMRRAATR